MPRSARAFYPDRAPLSLTGSLLDLRSSPCVRPAPAGRQLDDRFSMPVSPLSEGWAGSESAKFAISWHRKKALLSVSPEEAQPAELHAAAIVSVY